MDHRRQEENEAPYRTVYRKIKTGTFRVLEFAPLSASTNASEDARPAALVMILHGFPDLPEGWITQAKALQKAGFFVVVPEQRGYGESEKPSGVESYQLDFLANDVFDLATSYGARRFHLVGHDWGGIVAWWMACNAPDRILRLAILNAPHPAVTRTYVLRHPRQLLQSSYVAFFQLPRIPEWLLSQKDFMALRNSLLKSSRPGAFSEGEMKMYVQAWKRPQALTSMLNWYRALPLLSFKNRAVKVTSPTLILWGDRDQFLQTGLAFESQKYCTESDLQILPESTHWLHREEALKINKELTQFFSREPFSPTAKRINQEIPLT